MKRSCTCSNLRELEEFKGSAAEFDLDDDTDGPGGYPRVKRQNSGLPRLMGSASVSGGLGFKPSKPPPPPSPPGGAAGGSGGFPLGLPPRSPTSSSSSPWLEQQQQQQQQAPLPPPPLALPSQQQQQHHQGLLARVESARLEFSLRAAAAVTPSLAAFSCAVAATPVPAPVEATCKAPLGLVVGDAGSGGGARTRDGINENINGEMVYRRRSRPT